MNKDNHSSPPSDVHIVLIGIAIVVITGIVAITFALTEPKKEDYGPVESMSKTTSDSIYVPYTSPPTEPPTTKPVGFYPDNHDVYCVGADYAPEEYYMPEGVYMLIANSDDGEAYFYKIGMEEENWQEEEYYSFQYSCIIKLEKGWDFMPTYCDAYSLDTFDGYGIENNPFEHGGMFRVGMDVPSGTYRVIVTNEQDYRHWALIYDDIDSIEYNLPAESNLLDNETAESIEVKLEDGNIIDLYGCILEKIS